MSRTLATKAARAGAGRSSAGGPTVLAQFSTRLPPELLERLRVAAPQLGLRQSDITTSALHEFLQREGF